MVSSILLRLVIVLVRRRSGVMSMSARQLRPAGRITRMSRLWQGRAQPLRCVFQETAQRPSSRRGWCSSYSEHHMQVVHGLRGLSPLLICSWGQQTPVRFSISAVISGLCGGQLQGGNPASAEASYRGSNGECKCVCLRILTGKKNWFHYLNCAMHASPSREREEARPTR